ncbi:E3 ubiquitin-protein ligase RNF19B [Penaeus vannamei]|uniref:E3 ubiquitin-protein ligase RNF19B n=1 Tax=Penaeus vannamei TaxID=6689 RepID=UPI000F661E44|nr:E3 ubiquitin-protein ligase RNF19B-like [Penaeus vannamei]XP_027208004.1 E3 ubiquitin-protein ligase RNF19B-like [Penaeus vannamei]XP_027208005.1 E3 ubiquitin-protein ligase RNF19B-like [Penaeus vannamei]
MSKPCGGSSSGSGGCQGGGVRTRTYPSVSSMERGGGGVTGSGSSSASGFPRMSLRSLLLNSPFSIRTRSKRVRTPTSSHKLTIEPERDADSLGVFTEGTGETTSWSSIKRHTTTSNRSRIGSRRGSVGSRGTARAESCSSEPGATASSCGNVSGGAGAGAGTGSTSVEGSSEGVRRECSLCLQEVSADLFPTLFSCPHSACLPCLKQYLKVEITESRVNISCPQCNELMHPTDIHQIVANDLLSDKFEDFMLRRVLSMDPDTRWCPAPDCGFAVIATGCAGCPKLKCERPGCGSYFCYHCKAEWHPNQTCDMARAQRSPNVLLSSFNYLHDIQTNDDVKSCPRCQVLIMKMDDGSCNHITCSVCGAEFCWLCMKEISDLHYLSPSGCTFWGKKPWTRKKKILWQLGTLIGAPLGIGLVAGLAVPAMIIGIPIWVGRKLHARYSNGSRHRRNLAVVGGVTASAVISPVLAGLAVSIGVPILLAYVYGVVPISLCRSGGCGVTTSASGVRIAFDDENDMVFGLPGRQSESSHVGGGTASIGEMSCGASLSADSAAHVLAESDRESASNTAIAPASLTGSIASSCISRTNRLEVHVDIAHGARSIASGETASLAISERSTHTMDTDNASTRALTGSLLQYKVSESEAEEEAGAGGDSASRVLEDGVGVNPHITSLYIHSIPPSASDNNSAVLTHDASSDQGATDLRLDSVSAIITARQFARRHSSSSKGVTFLGDSCEASDHVALTLDDDDEHENGSDSLFGNEEIPGNCPNITPMVDLQNESERAVTHKNPGGRLLHKNVLFSNSTSTLPLVHESQRKKKSKGESSKRRASSAEGKVRNSSKPVRCESFPKLESQ